MVIANSILHRANTVSVSTVLLKDEELENEEAARSAISDRIKHHLLQRAAIYVTNVIADCSQQVRREMKVMFRSTISPEVQQYLLT